MSRLAGWYRGRAQQPSAQQVYALACSPGPTIQPTRQCRIYAMSQCRCCGHCSHNQQISPIWQSLIYKHSQSGGLFVQCKQHGIVSLTMFHIGVIIYKLWILRKTSIYWWIWLDGIWRKFEIWILNLVET